MGRAIPFAIREQIIKERADGKSLSTLAMELGLSYDGVCKIWRNYQHLGQEALLPQYSKCGRKATYEEVFQERVKAYRLTEGGRKLGAPYIRSKLLASQQYEVIPHERTMQRWLRQAGIHRPCGRGPKQESAYSVVVHETWQGDAKENLRLLDGQPACYFSLSDEASGTFLHGEPFPPGQN